MKSILKSLVVGVLSFFAVVAFAQVTSTNSAQGDVDPNAGTVSSCLSLTSTNLRYQARDSATKGEVSILQDFLQSQRYLNSEPTGYFGLMTKAAVTKFQKTNNLSGTGYVGPLTIAAIKRISCNGTSPVVGTNPNNNSNNDSTPALGCSRGAIFNSQTGQRCVNNIVVSSVCGSGVKFNSITGQPCSSTSQLLPVQNPIPAPVLSTNSFIIVTSPAGEAFKVGDVLPISWQAGNLTSNSMINVTLKPTQGTNGTLYVLNNNNWIDSTMSSFRWTIPTSINPGTYNIVISGTGIYNNPSGTSQQLTINSATTITPPPTVTTPTITITSPNGGESYTNGSGNLVTISWRASGLTTNGRNNIDLMDSNGNVYYTIFATNLLSGSSYQWGPLNNFPKGSYKIRITSFDPVTNVTVSDTSDNYFTITEPAPSITVLAPNGGETLSVGSSYAIRWSTSNFTQSNVRLGITGSANQGADIAVVPNTGSYTWNVPSTLGSMNLTTTNSPIYKIGISAENTSPNFAADLSDSSFAVTQ